MILKDLFNRRKTTEYEPDHPLGRRTKRRQRTHFRGVIIAAAMITFVLSAAFVSADSAADGAGVDWTCFQNSSYNNGVTTRFAAPDAAHAVQCFDGVQFEQSLTPPVIAGDDLYVAAGHTVYRVNRKTGAVEAKNECLEGDVGFAMHPMVYADGKLYAATGSTDGDSKTMIEAVDAPTLKHLWSSGKYSGQNLSPLSYRKINGKGYLYTGTGVYDNQRKHFSDGGVQRWFFCVSAADGSRVFDLADGERGYYWAGACVTDRYVVFGSSNDSVSDITADGSRILSLDPVTGKEISRIENLKGDFRSSIVRDGNWLYAGTTGGRLYRIHISDDGVLAEKPEDGGSGSDYSYIDLGDSMRGAVAVCDGRIYAGYTGSDGKYYYAVLDGSQPLNSGSLIYKTEVDASPTGAPLLSVPSGDTEKTRYLYFTCNSKPGGIYCLSDKPGQTSASEVEEIYTPESAAQEHCISPLALSSDGVLYYKNDSRYLMAVAPKLLDGVRITQNGTDLRWNGQSFQPNVFDCTVNADDAAGDVEFHLTGIDSETKYEITANGVSQGEDTRVKLSDGAKTPVDVTVNRRGAKAEYHFSIRKATAADTSLRVLTLTEGERYDDSLIGGLTDGKYQYQTEILDKSRNDFYLWALPEYSSAEVRVYAEQNVRSQSGNKLLKKGSELDYSWQEQSDSSYKYPVRSMDASKDTVIRIRVTSADRKHHQDYYLTIDRKETSQKVKAPSKVTGVKAKSGRGKVTVSWKKASRASGYEVRIAKDKKFRKEKKSVKLSGASKCKKTMKQSRGTRYLQVRAYTKSGGRTLYGKYSNTVKVRIR